MCTHKVKYIHTQAHYTHANMHKHVQGEVHSHHMHTTHILARVRTHMETLLVVWIPSHEGCSELEPMKATDALLSGLSVLCSELSFSL